MSVVCDLPGVGRNLQDHLAVGVVVAARQPVSLVGAESLGNLLRYLLLRRGMLTSNVAEACAFVRTSPELPAADLELLFAPVPFMDHGFTKPSGHGLTIGAVLLRPESTGTITLRSADPFAPPVIDPRYLSDADGHDLRVLVAGVRLARRVFDARAFADYVGAPIEPSDDVRSDVELERFIREQAETLYHPVGTCRMGVDDMAVVDPELRVRGVEGLRVVDASVMPVIVRGHTNAATIMIAERAAELMSASRVAAVERRESRSPAPPHRRDAATPVQDP